MRSRPWLLQTQFRQAEASGGYCQLNYAHRKGEKPYAAQGDWVEARGNAQTGWPVEQGTYSVYVNNTVTEDRHLNDPERRAEMIKFHVVVSCQGVCDADKDPSEQTVRPEGSLYNPVKYTMPSCKVERYVKGDPIHVCDITIGPEGLPVDPYL